MNRTMNGASQEKIIVVLKPASIIIMAGKLVTKKYSLT